MKLLQKGTLSREILDWVVTLGIAVIAALIVQRYVFTLTRVLGPSMEETLYTNQVMAVLRVNYYFNEPQRGDVVFCHYPGWEEDCVKRVIGLPGERLKIVDSTVYINDEPLEEPYLTLPDTSDFNEVVVPEGSYFVLGDNRRISLDSRGVGALERNAIGGQCLGVVWPMSAWKSL